MSRPGEYVRGGMSYIQKTQPRPDHTEMVSRARPQPCMVAADLWASTDAGFCSSTDRSLLAYVLWGMGKHYTWALSAGSLALHRPRGGVLSPDPIRPTRRAVFQKENWH